MLPRTASVLSLSVFLLVACTAPVQVITPQVAEESPTPAIAPTLTPTLAPDEPTPEPEPLRIALAAHVADRNNLPLLKEMGGTWFVSIIRWLDIEREDVTPFGGPPYLWDTLQPTLNDAVAYDMKLILRIDSAPDWAWREGDPPLDIAAFADFMDDMARLFGNWIAAYVIWNEPNLPSSWGGRTPNPAWYAQMLQAVYPRIRRWDPDAIIVASGLATIGGDGCPGEETTVPPPQSGAVSDLAFLRGLYEAGAQGYFDVLGTHPYGFAYPPEEDPCAVNGQAFRRAEQQQAIMEQFGDSAKPMWALEFGWVVRPPTECESDPAWQGTLWQAVDEKSQANYLTQAVHYADENWPWMQLMAVFNFDFAAVPTYQYCHPFRYWSLAYRFDPYNSQDPIYFREAYYRLQELR